MECVTSAQFSLLVNGHSTKRLRAKNGLRQGDPMSPLLFVLCMEYLSRMLLYVGNTEGFQFHPSCKLLHLNHLCFAYDLMIFCKGDSLSASMLIQSLQLFGDTLRLFANKSKTTFYTTGIFEEFVQDITSLSGFVRGSFPFKYLGIPLTIRKLKPHECDCLWWVE